ncbi:MAG TPA: 2-phosphosulfolactate phosphatase [Bacillales bacterium]|nr:2-phosphosulfolactate phosphatase [Bacillales bacterium]
MGKIHLLMRKEDIDVEQMKGKVAVVFDVLLATSTITAAFDNGAQEVIPVLNEEEALREAEGRAKDSYVLSGEYSGLTLDGFLSPSPLGLKGQVKGKTVILSTTNGTVAIKNVAVSAQKVFAASLLNGKAVAKAINDSLKDETIVVVCSGSMESFCLEDFYGAGYFLDCLVGLDDEMSWELTDSATAALYFYRGNKDDSLAMLDRARVGKMLDDFGLADDIRYVAERGGVSAVPAFDGKAIVDEKVSVRKGGIHK